MEVSVLNSWLNSGPLLWKEEYGIDMNMTLPEGTGRDHKYKQSGEKKMKSYVS